MTDSDISLVEHSLPSNVKTYVGTRQIYQYKWVKINSTTIKFNTLSCFLCKSQDNCCHFYHGKINYNEEQISNETILIEKKSVEKKEVEKKI